MQGGDSGAMGVSYPFGSVAHKPDLYWCIAKEKQDHAVKFDKTSPHHV